jgi:phage-related protein
VAAKPLVWVGATLDRLRGLPAAARREAGYQLYRVQRGLDPRFAEAVYVLHAFEKRTQQTRQADLELARRNLAEVLRHRRAK